MRYISEASKIALKEAVGLRPVLDYLGIPMHKKYILCPNPEHDDHNYGSCVVNEKNNRIHCYAGGADYDSIGLLQEVCNWTFEESVCFLAKIAGYPEDMLYEETEEDVFYPSKDERQAVGLKGSSEGRSRLYTGISYEKPENGCFIRESDEYGNNLYISYKSSFLSFLDLDREMQEEIFKNLAVDRCIQQKKLVNEIHARWKKQPENKFLFELFFTVLEQFLQLDAICRKYMPEEELNQRIQKAFVTVDFPYQQRIAKQQKAEGGSYDQYTERVGRPSCPHGILAP